MKKGWKILLGISILCPFLVHADITEQEQYFFDTLTAQEQILIDTLGSAKQERYYNQIHEYLGQKMQAGKSLPHLGAQLEHRLALLEYDSHLSDERKHKLQLVGQYVQLIIKENQLLLSNTGALMAQNNTLEQTQEVENAILTLQKHIQGALLPAPLKTQLGTLLSGKKQTGNMKIWGDISDTQFGKYSGKLEFTDIDAYAKGFDSTMNAKVLLDITSSSGGVDTQELGLTTWLEMIQKNASTYIKLKQLEASITDNPVLGSYLELLKKMAKDEKYTRMPQGQSMTTLILGTVQTQIQDFLAGNISSPLYTSKSHSGAVYSLLPTQEWCGLSGVIPSDLEELIQVPENCDTQTLESQFLEDKTQAFLDLSSPNKKVFHYSKVLQDVLLVTDIVYDDTQILSLHYNITPNQNSFPGEGITLDFVKDSYFSLHANIGGVGNIDITSQLGAKNSIQKLDAYALIDNTFTLDVHIQDKRITGTLVLTRRDFSSEEVQYIPMIQADISGAMDEQDHFASLDIIAKISGLVSSEEQGNMSIHITPKSFGVDLSYTLAGAYSFIAKISNLITQSLPNSLSQDFRFDVQVDKDGQQIGSGHIQAVVEQVEEERGEVLEPSEFVDVEDIDVGSQVEIME